MKQRQGRSRRCQTHYVQAMVKTKLRSDLLDFSCGRQLTCLLRGSINLWQVYENSGGIKIGRARAEIPGNGHIPSDNSLPDTCPSPTTSPGQFPLPFRVGLLPPRTSTPPRHTHKSKINITA